MSVQFGKCNFDGKPVDLRELAEVRPLLTPYGPDGESYICKDNFGLLYRAFHTTKESHRETQPFVSKSGLNITWDGRLDNRDEITGQLPRRTSSDCTDLEVIAASYECWGTDAFAKLIGDWAVSVWNPQDQSVILANDFLGLRHIYYMLEEQQLSWCTVLDPLVLFARHSLQIEEEYVAGWISSFPATHLTPYTGILSVQPSSFVRFASGEQRTHSYWDFDRTKRIRYCTDAQYEEHLRVVFSQSVRRRLRSNRPVLAELSGGIDSSSIVCVADDIIARGLAEAPRLETVSYYDDSEPNWNERPYFTKVEQKRGRAGEHIDTCAQPDFGVETEGHNLSLTPGSGARPTPSDERFADCILSRGSRVVLSGIGGDEFLGGVPNPVPEIADALASFRLISLAFAVKAWALRQRRPCFHLLLGAIREFFPVATAKLPESASPAPWLDSQFVERNQSALSGYMTRLKFFGGSPSFQENLRTLSAVRRFVGSQTPAKRPLYEKRYPYLDRDLLEFLYAIPREQLLRPHQRRSLMRRAMAGLVPDEILARRRKGFVVRSPILTLSTKWDDLLELCSGMLSDSLGIIDQAVFIEALQKARAGREVPTHALIKTLQIERWLRSLNNHRSLRIAGTATRIAVFEGSGYTERVISDRIG